MTEVDEKITSEPVEAQEVEEINQLNAEEIPEEILEAIPEVIPEPPQPVKKKAKKQLIVEIPVDAPSAPVLERATSSAAPATKARGRPKGAVGAAKRAPAAPPPTPRETQLTHEEHMILMLRHTRQMQEAHRTTVRDKYRSWVA
jgi:hypothetical protein